MTQFIPDFVVVVVLLLVIVDVVGSIISCLFFIPKASSVGRNHVIDFGRDA